MKIGILTATGVIGGAIATLYGGWSTGMAVALAYRMDVTIGTTYIQNAVIIGFIANEMISIVENAGLMGIPIPDAITRGIEMLVEKKNEENTEVLDNGNSRTNY